MSGLKSGQFSEVNMFVSFNVELKRMRDKLRKDSDKISDEWQIEKYIKIQKKTES